MMDLNDLENTKNKLQQSLFLLNKYQWLLDSYVLDFYVDNHWNKIPISWQKILNGISTTNLVHLLKNDLKSSDVVWPLSLIALQVLLKDLNIPRHNSEFTRVTKRLVLEKELISHPRLKNIFTKHVKPKKRHEVDKMSEVCARTARDCEVEYIVDFGAGLGHLSRRLAYGYGLNVCCFEQQTNLTNLAKNIDQQLEVSAAKHLSSDRCDNLKRPVHLNIQLTKDTSSAQFLHDIRSAFGIFDPDFKFGIVGLHPCGDLAAILLRIYMECPQAIFINLVGCCYMKISCNLEYNGYPLSQFLIDLHPDSQLSYESREIACHAIETYAKRLSEDDYDHLKIHSYRASIEKIIVTHWPNLKHSGLKSIKYKNNLTFKKYCEDAVEHLGIKIPEYEVNDVSVEKDLNEWKNVVIFYALRLMFAPLVETVLLLDRFLLLKEFGADCRLEAIFDPILSPRNHILTAIKNSS